MLQILLAAFLGIIAGTFTGLTPGIHINLVAALLFILSATLLAFTSPIVLACFIVSMATAHNFIDFIPSIFLGAPEESTALSVLPGHKLLLEGRGYEAIKLTTIGCYIGIILLFILIPLFLLILPDIYETLSWLVPFVLILASAFLILKEKNPILGLIIFISAGVIGVLSLNFYIIREPLFPLLTGLFGISTILISINEKTVLPKQYITKETIKTKEIISILPSSIIASSLCSFLPGLGSSQAAVIGSQLEKDSSKPENFLVLLGIISTLVLGLNFAALYIINKSRSGAGIIIQKLIPNLTLNQIWLILVVMLISGSIAVFLSMAFARIFAKNISKINYIKVNVAILIILVIMSIFISGWLSLLVIITATALGILAIKTSVRRIQLMGCLIVPVIMYFIL